MGYWIYATMTQGDNTQEFVVSETRASHDVVFASIVNIHPETADAPQFCGYPHIALTAPQAVSLLESWAVDIDAVVAHAYDEDAPAPNPDAFYARINSDYCHVLQRHIHRMRNLARNGYDITFKAG